MNFFVAGQKRLKFSCSNTFLFASPSTKGTFYFEGEKKVKKIKVGGLKLNERVDMVLGCTFWWVGGVCFEEGGAENGQVGGLKSGKRSCFWSIFSEN